MSKNLQEKCAVKTKQNKRKKPHTYIHTESLEFGTIVYQIQKKMFHILKEIKQKLGKIKEQQNNHTDLKTRAFKDEKNSYI